MKSEDASATTLHLVYSTGFFSSLNPYVKFQINIFYVVIFLNCRNGKVKFVFNFLNLWNGILYPSCIFKTSDSVCLDLLTYNDLETLRQKKSGTTATIKSTIPAPRSAHIASKRYLILTYTVEFDRYVVSFSL